MSDQPHHLNGKRFGDLLVEGEARKLNRSRNRFWPCRCLRPVHDEVLCARRWVTALELTTGTVTCCVACSSADRRGRPRRRHIEAASPDSSEVQRAPVRGCAQLGCRGRWHQPDCERLNLFPQTEYTRQKDPGKGIYAMVMQ